MDTRIMQELEELCETVSDNIAETNKKIRNSQGNMNANDLEQLDKLTHILKSIKTVMAMGEYEDEEGYSRRDHGYRDGGYARRYNRGSSYAGGRGSNARRDSMGRYRDGGREEMMEHLEALMESAPNDAVRQKVQRLMGDMESA